MNAQSHGAYFGPPSAAEFLSDHGKGSGKAARMNDPNQRPLGTGCSNSLARVGLLERDGPNFRF